MGKRNTTDDPLVRYFLDEYRLNLLVGPRAGKGGPRDRGWDELRNVPAHRRAGPAADDRSSAWPRDAGRS